MNFDDFKAKWDEIPVYGNSFLLVDSTHPIEFNIGYEQLNQKTLFVANSGEIKGVASSKSIEAKNYRFPDGQWVLTFKLIRSDNEDVFLWFCWDMIQSSRYLSGGLMNFVLKRYSKWLRLMEHKKSDLMDIASQKGLLGELIHLQKIAFVYGIQKAVMSWSGPDGADQDFIFDCTWNEIKSTVLSSESVSISSLEQLDMKSEGRLVIYYLEKTTTENSAGFSLFDKVRNVRVLCESQPDIKDMFEMKLLEYGYRDGKEYDEVTYRLCKADAYVVTSDFPKLTKSNVCSGITQAKYSISLVSIEAFRIKEE